MGDIESVGFNIESCGFNRGIVRLTGKLSRNDKAKPSKKQSLSHSFALICSHLHKGAIDNPSIKTAGFDIQNFALFPVRRKGRKVNAAFLLKQGKQQLCKLFTAALFI